MMMTINALCLDTITEFLGLGNGHIVRFIRNIHKLKCVNVPLLMMNCVKNIMMKFLTGPKDVREKDEKDANGISPVQEWEQDPKVSRLIEYPDVVKTPDRNTAEKNLLEHDSCVL